MKLLRTLATILSMGAFGGEAFAQGTITITSSGPGCVSGSMHLAGTATPDSGWSIVDGTVTYWLAGGCGQPSSPGLTSIDPKTGNWTADPSGTSQSIYNVFIEINFMNTVTFESVTIRSDVVAITAK